MKNKFVANLMLLILCFTPSVLAEQGGYAEPLVAPRNRHLELYKLNRREKVKLKERPVYQPKGDGLFGAPQKLYGQKEKKGPIPRMEERAKNAEAKRERIARNLNKDKQEIVEEKRENPFTILKNIKIADVGKE